jgi:hypothetical protein
MNLRILRRNYQKNRGRENRTNKNLMSFIRNGRMKNIYFQSMRKNMRNPKKIYCMRERRNYRRLERYLSHTRWRISRHIKRNTVSLSRKCRINNNKENPIQIL